MSPITPQSRPQPPPTGGLRERQADFVANGTLAGLNATVRPDALVLDPLTAYTTGPVAIGDQSQGPTAWVWRVQVVGLAVLIARENDTRTGWNASTTLFTFTGIAFTEVDLAFEQQGNSVVCAERATGAGGSPEVWVYFLDAVVGGFVLRSFGAGRTPRAALDNPQNPSSSDVLVAYLDPVADGVRLRQQRDKYAVVYAAPLSGIANFFLEEMFMATDNRLRLILTERNPTAGTYSLRVLDSVLYPFALRPEDAISPAHPVVLASSTLIQTILLIAGATSPSRLVPEDAIRPAHPIVLATSVLAEPLIVVAGATSPFRLVPEDAIRPDHPIVLATSTLRVVLIVVQAGTDPRLVPEDAISPAHPVVLATSSLVTVLIVVQDATNPRVLPEDALSPAHPVVLATSTLI